MSNYLLLWGLPGLFVIAFIDSAAVPMMGGLDALVLLLACVRPMQILPIVLSAAIGSLLGCLVLYRVGRAGGEMALSRFNPTKRAWVKQKFDQNAFAAVMAGVVAPPPFPFKFVILAAGAFRVSQVKFIGGVLAGRLVRYAILAYLGAHFGDQAAQVVTDHYPMFALLIVGALILYLVVRHFRGHANASTGE